MKLADIRRDFKLAELDESSVDDNPFKQFEKWFSEVLNSDITDPTAMSLATVDSEGRPNLRVVLLKEINETGLVFFTNYNSAKGTELRGNNQGCINFYWAELERQVRIQGEITKISAEDSDEYFYSRPIESQIGGIASQQSKVLEDREDLVARINEIKNSGKEIKRPDNWGGYVLIPTYFEFWQGRASRLHDRIAFSLENGTWKIERLNP